MTDDRPGRLHSLDHLKAAAIVAVVLTHAGPDTLARTGAPEVWLVTKVWTVFHVPSFLFVSGFLYASPHGLAWRSVARRLSRVLVPYLVASAFGLALVVRPASFGEAALRLLTGDTFGIYYYIFLFAACLLLMGPLSWAGRRGAVVVGLAYGAYTVAVWAEPSLRSSQSIFWLVRDPLQIFNFGFFLTGWLVGIWRPELSGLARRRPWLLPAAAVALTVSGLLLEARVVDVELAGLNRVPYSLGVIALFLAWNPRRPAGPALRLLSDATLAIYLYHFFFVLWVRPEVAAWPPLAGVAAQVVAGLTGSIAVVGAARLLLGRPRARRWLGA